ncbi:MAG TPA: exopolysaccharide biosynthesis protein [Tepidisphaeraceae bacterium]|nr:exopolysaccharide biosynthesis protein [Tepidisphaeraceae bacterium]
MPPAAPPTVPDAATATSTEGVDRGLAEVLAELEAMGAEGGGGITIRTLIDRLADRGPAVAVFLLSAPFVFIPIPGLSTVVGLAVFGLSLAIIVGGRPWLPGFIAGRHVSPENLRRFSQGTGRVLAKLQKFVRRRMSWLTAPGLYQRLVGVSLVSATVLFALPLPIPGNNIPPAIGMSLLALGLIQRDGLLVLIGHVYTLLLWVALIVAVVVFWNVVDDKLRAVWHKLFGGGDPAATQPVVTALSAAVDWACCFT